MTGNQKDVDRAFRLAEAIIYEQSTKDDEGHAVPVIKDCKFNDLLIKEIKRLICFDPEKDEGNLQTIIVCGRIAQLTKHLERWVH